MDGGPAAAGPGDGGDRLSEAGSPRRERAPGGSEPEQVDGFPIWLAGHYRRDRRLGRGGMGVVYRYRDTKLDRLIAVKALPDAVAAHPDRRERFRHEARVLASLDHPHVARIHHIVEDEQGTYLVLEYVGGQTLTRRLLRGPLAVAQALSVAHQIAQAVEAGHALKVIHRDVKPGNIMVTATGVAKLLDYGLARYESGPEDEADGDPGSGPNAPTVAFQTRRGGILGTPGYMSPEQAVGAELDHRTDAWALACVLFECLTGQVAFPGESHKARIEATLEAEPDWSQLPAELPDDVRDLLLGCLRKPLAERIADMAVVRRRLRRALDAVRRGGPAVPTNLPSELTGFVGRPGEVDRLQALVWGGRLVTLTGMGGAGKSRLAREIARSALLDAEDEGQGASYADGIWLVELAGLSDGGQLAGAVASVVLPRLGERKAGGADVAPADELVAALADRRLLLLLDNCEHLAEAAAGLTRTLLRRCPGLRILATSREPLRIPGEHTYVVPELSFPPPDADRPVLGYEAVQLFAALAALARPGFVVGAENADAVAAICRHVEGIPLAIELAAARVSALPVAQIERHLYDVLDPGHVLESSLEWSLAHLDDDERTLLARLAFFRGGWTLEAAEAVCEDADSGAIGRRPVIELLAALVEKSLVRYEERGDRARYRLLEPVRHHLERHLAGEVEAIRDHHMAFFLRLAEEADEHFSSDDQAAWLDRLEQEHDNLRRALATCRRLDDGADPGARLVVALHMFWQLRGYVAEGRAWLEAFIERRLGRDDLLLLRTSNSAGIVAERQGDYPAAHAHYDRALAIARSLGDRPRAAGILTNFGLLAQSEGELEAAQRHHEESVTIYESLDDPIGVAMARLNLADVLKARSAFDAARCLLEPCLEVFRRTGDVQRIGAALHNLGEIAARAGETSGAERLLREALETRGGMRDRKATSQTLLWLAITSRQRSDYERSTLLLAAAETMRRREQTPWNSLDAVDYDACLAAIGVALDDATRGQVWEAGAALSYEQATAYALHGELPGSTSVSGSLST
ncbi:MAG: protein kinase domain-containing protein [Planctomycetota bacterium]|jgi:non-specific serine/threonine protein kinase